MKKTQRIISALLCVAMLLGIVPMSAFAADTAGLENFTQKNIFSSDTFEDVSADDWFYYNVGTAYIYGLMKGNSATTFNPDGYVTIAEAITIAARLNSIYHTGTESFENGTPWYQPYIDYAKEYGIIKSDYEDYNKPATRAEFAEILAAALPDEALEAINKVADNKIPDVTLDDSYGEAVYKLYRAGILTGNDDEGTFSPDSYIKRSEVAAIVSRMADCEMRESIQIGEYYTVTFELGNGKTETQTVFESELVIEPKTPTRIGYIFNGWYTTSINEEKFDFNTHIIRNITVYAHWVMNTAWWANWNKLIDNNQDETYTVTFTLNNSTYLTTNVKVGSVVEKPTNPHVDGFTFYDWYDSNGYTFDFNTEINNDITLYGLLIPNKYTENEIIELLNGYYGEVSKDLEADYAPFEEIEVKYTLSDTGVVTIRPQSSSPFINIPGLVGSPFEIKDVGGEIISAEIIFHYNPDLLGALSPDDLAIFYYSEDGNIVVIDDTIVNTEECTISVSTNHLSIWGVISKTIWNKIQDIRYPTLRTEKTPYYNVILALDNSGSMDSGTKMSDCIDVANNFIDVLSDNDNVTLITFGSIPIVHFSQMKLKEDENGEIKDNHSYIKGIISSLSANGGGTDIDMTMNSAADKFTDDPNYQNILIIVSDGQSSVCDSTLNKIEQSDSKVLTVGIGSDVDAILLENIALATGGSYIQIEDTTDLQNAFIQLQNVYIGSSIDSDNDGLPDIVESTGMRDQFGEIYKTDPNNPDSDNDGINDGEEMGTYHSGNRPYFERTSRPDMKTEIVDECIINNCYLEYIEAVENNSKLHLVLTSTCSLYRVYPNISTPYEELIALEDATPTEYIYKIPECYDAQIEVFTPENTEIHCEYTEPKIIDQDIHSITYQHDIYVNYTNNSINDITAEIKKIDFKVEASTINMKYGYFKTIIFDGTTEYIDDNGNVTVLNPISIFIEKNAELALGHKKLEAKKRWDADKQELAINIVKYCLDAAKDIKSVPIEQLREQIIVYEVSNSANRKELNNVPDAVYEAFAISVYESITGSTIDELKPIKAPYDVTTISNSFCEQIKDAIDKGLTNFEYTYYDGSDTWEISGQTINLAEIGTNWCYVYKNNRPYAILYYENVYTTSGQKALADFFTALQQLNTDSWKEFVEEFVLVFFTNIGSSKKKADIEKAFDYAEEIIKATKDDEEAKKFVNKYIKKGADELLGKWTNWFPGGKSTSTVENLKKFIKQFVPNGSTLIDYSEKYQRIEECIEKIETANSSGDVADYYNQIVTLTQEISNAFSK